MEDFVNKKIKMELQEKKLQNLRRKMYQMELMVD